MAGIFSVAGTQIYIGSATSAKITPFVAADFTLQSWVRIAWVENLGQFGDEAAEIAFSPIDVSRTMKLKGTFNAGTLALVVGRDYTDSGQNICLIANGLQFDYSFRVIFNDMPSGGVAGSIRYFIAKIMSFREQFDTVNNVIRANVSLGINSNVVAIAAH
jgi:hypothetical protein